MRPEQITAFNDQVVGLIRTYQQEHNSEAMPYAVLLEQFEKLLLNDEKFKSAEYLTAVLSNIKSFKRIESHDAANGEATYEVVE